RSVAGVLRTDKSRYAALLTSEMGKPIVEAEAEIEKCAWTAGWFAENGERLLAEQRVESTGAESYVRFHPLGVILAVMPWNFPFWQAFRAGLPALTAGNVMLLKHSSNVPHSALAIEEVFREAGVPEGVFQSLLIGSAAVERLISDNRVAGVPLTGSDTAGAPVATRAKGWSGWSRNGCAGARGRRRAACESTATGITSSRRCGRTCGPGCPSTTRRRLGRSRR